MNTIAIDFASRPEDDDPLANIGEELPSGEVDGAGVAHSLVGEDAAQMRSWRAAKSLEVLTRELDSHFPHRDKASDGTIGDDNHSSRSDHFPNASGVVRA